MSNKEETKKLFDELFAGWRAYLEENAGAMGDTAPPEVEDEPWEITIRYADNGFILTRRAFEDNGEEVITHPDDIGTDPEEAKAKASQALLWRIVEFFELYGDKYSKYTLKVSIEPGRKYVERKEDDPDD